MMKRNIVAGAFSLLLVGMVQAQQVDYSVVSVPEESGIEFMQVSTPSDYVCMPIVQRTMSNVNWCQTAFWISLPMGKI